MSKALLVSLALDKFSYPAEGRFRVKQMQRRPLLGLLYICSAIESKGVECDLLNQSINYFSIEDLVSRAKENDYVFIGFYSQLLIKDKLIEYIGALKKCIPKIKIIAGGPGYICSEELLRIGCDIVCMGEAELTIGDIIEYIQGDRGIEDIPGIAYRRGDDVIYNKERDLISNLDSIPFPSWHKIDLSSYCDYTILPIKNPFSVMITSRGCPFNCAFCSSPFLWKNAYRTRSVNNVLKEIDLLVSKGVKYIIFQDDVFGMDNKWLKEFCILLAKRGYGKLEWMCLIHPLIFKNNADEFIGLMKKAGCNLFVLGLQTRNKLLLADIKRNPLEPEYIRMIVKAARKFGIMTSVDFILGLPGETVDTISENIDFAIEVNPHLVNFHPLRVEPGSELAKRSGQGNYVFSRDEINRFCNKANKDFYFRIEKLMQLFGVIITRNPLLLFKLIKLYTLLEHDSKQHGE